MAEWTMQDTVLVLFQMISMYFYKSCIDTPKKFKFPTRCILNRLYVVALLCVCAMNYLGVFGRESCSNEIDTVCIFWFVSLLMSMLFSDGWCCGKCGKRIGLKILFVNHCPYCHKAADSLE